jgi:transglutaminase-like putative cysteine protease
VRLALLLIVLTLSVGMLSTAINILGDITRLNLDENKPGPANPVLNPGALGKTNQEVPVGGDEPKALGPIMEIRMSTGTRYLRRMPAENYSDGSWWPTNDYPNEKYNGEQLTDYNGYPIQKFNQFLVTPLTTFSGFVVVAPTTQSVKFNGTLNYYPELQAFESEEPFMDPYWVSNLILNQPEASLMAAQAIGTDSMLEIPSGLKSQFRDLALQITDGYNSPYEKLLAIETYLKDNYKFDKDFSAPPNNTDPVIWFLFNDKRGVGTHFNSAFILLARSIDIPVRAVIGYLIDPYSEIQYVMPQQVYLYAEAKFQGVGWVIFDAAPKHYTEGDLNITQEPTYTNITGNDPVAIKGNKFNVWGTVKMANGSAVSGPQVEILLKVNKTDTEEKGIVTGAGFVENGLFNITCDASPDLLVGDYNLVAHTLENRWFKESFSDPAIKIMTETNVKISGPKQVYSGRNITYRGYVIDASNNEPLTNITLRLDILNGTTNLLSDSIGRVGYQALFPKEGKYNITLRLENTDFYIGSSAAYTVTVLPPPPTAQSILSLLFGFPNNIIIALGAALGVGVFASRRSKRIKEEEYLEPRVDLPLGKEKIGWEDGAPLEYGSYEEGVVKLFNRFYVSMQRRFKDIDDTWTPREFEYAIIDRLPLDAHAALEDLITSYEIAMYSNIPVSVEDFNRTNATIELIIELMKHE